MKTVYIVRHAKSSWEYDGINDWERPLKKRGINDANLVAQELKNLGIKPDALISSSAARALNTALIFCNQLEYPFSNLKINHSLYSFSDRYLVKTIKALDGGYQQAMIFSHDHGINDFVNRYGGKDIDHIPTCSVVQIDFDVKHWKDIKKGEIKLFLTPKSLKKV